MGKKCYVPNCKTGYASCKDKLSLFKTPTDPEKLTKWQKVISRKDRKLTSKDHVCEKHFEPNLIIRHWVKIHEGKIMVKVPLQTCRLADEALPSLFLNPSSKTSKQRKQSCLQATSPKAKPRPLETKRKTMTVKEEETVEVEQNKCIAITEPLCEPAASFNDIWYNVLKVHLPDESWAVHRVTSRSDRCLVYCKAAISKGNSPIFPKRVVVNGELLLITSYVFNKMNTNDFRSVEQLDSIIAELHSMKLCRGGPNVSSLRNNVPDSDCCLIDEDQNLRHKSCSLICVNADSVCTFCNRLFDTSQNTEKYVSLKKPNRMCCNLTPSKKELQTVRKTLNGERRVSDRLFLKIKAENEFQF